MDNVGFLAAAYIVTFVVIGVYTGSLYRRLRRLRRLRRTRRAADAQAERSRGTT